MNRVRTIVIPGLIGLAALAGLQAYLFSAFGPMRALFLQIAGLGLVLALGVVLARNLVHAALALVGFNFLIACLFVLLEAELLAAVQVLVYIGAVAILLMFGIMLTRDIQGDETTRSGLATRLPAALVALAFLGLLLYGMAQERGLGSRPAWSQMTSRPALDTPEREAAVNQMGLTLGVELMTRWMVPFEVAGLLLTAALVGAVALAMSTPDDVAEGTPGRRGRSRTASPGPAGAPLAIVPPAAASPSESPLAVSSPR